VQGREEGRRGEEEKPDGWGRKKDEEGRRTGRKEWQEDVRRKKEREEG
jgi:hypothetical protein